MEWFWLHVGSVVFARGDTEPYNYTAPWHTVIDTYKCFDKIIEICIEQGMPQVKALSLMPIKSANTKII